MRLKSFEYTEVCVFVVELQGVQVGDTAALHNLKKSSGCCCCMSSVMSVLAQSLCRVPHVGAPSLTCKRSQSRSGPGPATSQVSFWLCILSDNKQI